MGEPNQVKWRGIRPVEPREAIPVQPFGDFGTQVAKHSSINNDTTIIHTVMSGKILYLCSLSFGMTPINAGEGWIFVRDENDNITYYLFTTYRQQNDGICISMTFNPPLIIPAGYDICIQSNTEYCYVNGFIFGYEV
ncbi:hypothetical protein DRN69_09010 [Candidatus Pacearchaeota archaeon]|nr:MAG: hypothetical protein DRN69_09010 [Candidatus Pacearchaeota archaeon]